MSTREVIGRLTDAKNKLPRIKAIGNQAANAVSEAAAAVNRVLDEVQDKHLSADLDKKAKEITGAFDGVMGLSRGLDTAIQNVRGIGRR